MIKHLCETCIYYDKEFTNYCNKRLIFIHKQKTSCKHYQNATLEVHQK